MFGQATPEIDHLTRNTGSIDTESVQRERTPEFVSRLSVRLHPAGLSLSNATPRRQPHRPRTHDPATDETVHTRASCRVNYRVGTECRSKRMNGVRQPSTASGFCDEAVGGNGSIVSQSTT
jgi:hypothetical protein